MTLEKLQVIIEAQTQAYYNELKKVQNQTRSATNAVTKTTDKIKGAFSKVGLAIAAALSVTAIVSFGKACINLGSDLAEVQNVVDVTFGSMSSTINDFARNAISQFGLSETSAKKYTSTMGAMLKSMGFTTSAAADMSMEMTGLAADMASFYNLDSEEAFNKIRAGISGETEPLKQLGINMSVANLEAYALSQGITKAYNAMTQQEQAMLRYNYLLTATADAQGDFARTSDGWANQVRVLTERFNSLKAAIGQGLIAVLTPVVKVLNELLARILTVTDAFSNMISKITGNGKKTTTTVSSIGESATNAGEGMETMAAGAGSAAKALAGLGSFDEVHTLSGGDSGGSGGSGVDTAAAGTLEESVVDAATSTEDSLNPVLDKLATKLKELKDILQSGFKAGLGDVNLDGIITAAEGIKTKLKEIFTDGEVVAAANNCLNSITYAFGQYVGAFASIGITIGTNLLGGINQYLQGNSQIIKDYLVSMFDLTAEWATIYGDFAQAAANIFSVFGGENAQGVTANLIGIFTNTAMAVSELAGKVMVDVTDLITRPFIDNQEAFKVAIDGYLGVLNEYLASVKQVVDDTAAKLREVYDASIGPMFESLATGLSDIVAVALEAWNTHILPVLEAIQEKAAVLINEHIQPAIDKGVELIGKIAGAVKDIWETTLQPFIAWFIEWIAPYIAAGLQAVGDAFMLVYATIADTVGWIFEALGGLIDFVAGIFTGDWSRAWEGIKTFFISIWEAIKTFFIGLWELLTSIVTTAINAIKGAIETVLNAISGVWNTIWNAIKTTATNIWNGIKTTITNTINSIKNSITNVFNSIKTTITNVINAIKTTITNIWNGIKSTTTSVWNGIKTAITTPINSAKSTITSVVNTVKNTITSGFNTAKNTVTSVFSSIYNTIKGKMDSAKTAVSNAISTLKSKFNFSWSLPSIKLPHISISGSFSLNPLRVPRFGISWYAKGGFPDFGELFIANEAGPEMIGRMGNKNVVANNNQIIQGIAAGVTNAISPLIATLMDSDREKGSTLHAVFEINGRKFAEGTITDFEEEARRRGGLRVTLV